MAEPARDYSQDDRLALGQAVTFLLQDWGLGIEEQAIVLGLGAGNTAPLVAVSDGAPLPEEDDVLERANRFLNLSLTLNALYGGESCGLKGWMVNGSEDLGGHKPFDFIREYGVTGLAWLEDHLHQKCARNEDLEMSLEFS